MNCLDTEDLPHKLYLIVTMVGLLSLAINSEAVFSKVSTNGFAVSYVSIRVLQASMYIWAGIWIPKDVRGNIIGTPNFLSQSKPKVLLTVY